MSGFAESVILVAERLVAGGDALARGGDGKVVFIPDALPGERVEVELIEQRRDFSRARVIKVIEASPHRVMPPCPHLARGCGGCTWQHLAPVQQTEAKVGIVRESLARIGRLPDAQVTVPNEPLVTDGRTTLRVGVNRNGRLGLRTRRSNDVVGLDSCLVAHPRLQELLRAVRLPGCTEAVLRVSVATGERMVWWAPEEHPTEVIVPFDVVVDPDSHLHEEVNGVRLRVSASSFSQPSPGAAAALVAAVREAAGPVGPSTTLVDAYGGVGLFGATVGAGAGRVVLVESSVSACADAEVNLHGDDHAGAEQGATDRAVTIVRQEVERWHPDASLMAYEDVVVVADPARSGLGKGAADVLAGVHPRVLVLVSCDAASLGRDTHVLFERGYRHAGSTVIDQFPHTHHVEVVSRFLPVDAPDVVRTSA